MTRCESSTPLRQKASRTLNPAALMQLCLDKQNNRLYDNTFELSDQKFSAAIRRPSIGSPFCFTLSCKLVDESYQKIRQLRGTRKGFFQDIQSLTRYFLFDSWQHLIDFMLDETDWFCCKNKGLRVAEWET